MATRRDLVVGDDDGDTRSGNGQPSTEPGPDESDPIPSKDGSETPQGKTKRLRKGWKDPADTAARGKFKTPKGNIREDF